VHSTTSHSPLDLLPLPNQEAWICQDGEAKASMIRDLHTQVKEVIERTMRKYQEEGNKGRKSFSKREIGYGFT